MYKCRRQWHRLLWVVLAAGIFFPVGANADTKGVPELALYWTHSTMFRSRFATNTTWSEDKSKFVTASCEYDLDVGLLSFFRRYVFKDPNFEKSKRITFRLGYAYFDDLTTSDSEQNEKRVLGEMTFRFPLGNAWLVTDRNRGELRRIDGEDTGRYRNRLRVERNIAIKGFKMTPYSNAEVFYDGNEDRWKQLDATVGSEFPWWYQTILEVYCTWQFTERKSDNKVIGLTLQKHI